MKPQTLPVSASMIPVVGLLVLAAIFSAARPVLAQTQEGCPLPPGLTPPPDPRVTAGQVENGSASLMDFALATRDQFVKGASTLEEALYIGCLVRLEGSPYRSGSTYLVQLTPDRIFVHAKNMALSGRQLNPLIYGAILQALGINPADLSSPASALAAFARASAGNGGPFNVPGIPGASGYAVVYLSATFPAPIVTLAGFDLNESHLAEETIDPGTPTITARDVVDRETLKSFVTQAGEFVLKHLTSGDLSGASKARIALRDPNGPWKHGSVYLYVLDTVSNIVTFHGAFPDRFELRPLVGIARDGRTGELILPQVLGAAASSPEGGFVRYYYDDPADDTDSADIPKVGYAREFSGELSLGGRAVPVNVIVGSGFYLSSPEVTAVRQNNVLQAVLPQVMRTMTASTVDAISGRIRQANARTAPATGLSLGGASTFSDVVLANGRALASGTFDLDRGLAGSSFSLPLDAALDSGGRGPLGSLTLWGNADYRIISEGSQQSTAYDGDVVSASLGIDTRLSEDLLGGVSVTYARGTLDYTDSESVTGEFTTTLSSVNPYMGWQLPDGTNLWGAAGYGRGDIEFDESTGTRTGDLTQRMVAAGVNRSLLSSERLIGGGTTSLIFKGETAFTRADVEGDVVLRDTRLSVNRHRVIFEGTHVRRFASGATLTPSIESGLRYDGGDGNTGAGFEVGAGLGYSAGRLAVKVNARGLLAQEEATEYEEWGFSGSLAFQPRSDGQGMSMMLGSGWGVSQSGVHALWSRRDAGTLARGGAAVHPAQRYRAELRYGLNGPMGGALWRPYLGTDSGGGSRALRMGVRLTLAQNLGAGLEIGRRESAFRAADHAIRIRGNMRF